MNRHNLMRRATGLAAAAAMTALVAGAAALPQTLNLTAGGRDITLSALSDDIIKVFTRPAGSTDTAPRSHSAVMAQRPVSVLTAFTADSATLRTPTTTAVVDLRTGRITFRDSVGRLLLTEASGLDNSGKPRTATFLTPHGENFYGAGERGHSLRLNGDTLVMYNKQNYGYTGSERRISQMNITVPWLVSSAGWGVLFDDFDDARMIVGADTLSYTTPSPTPLAYYFVNGQGTPAGTVANYSRLTGLQPLPPFWALGYITSKYGYHNAAEALGAVDSLKQRDYPVDGLVLDLYWYGKETDMGRLEWDKTRWGNHRAFLDSLKRRGVNTVLISQPYINKIGAIDNYNMLASRGMLTRDSLGQPHDVTTWVGEAGMFDVSNPDTRAWLAKRYMDLTDDGVAAWWGDLGEPEVHPDGIRHYNGLAARQYHNLYGNEWSRIIADTWRDKYPDRRLMLLMRGGTAGLQRYGVMPWSTDVSRSWGGFEPQVRIMLNSGLSGLGYMSSDIGGFAVDPAAPTDPELYVRWLEAGAFSPMLRTHAQLKPEPYHYPEYADITRRYIRMRYQWLPYNYTLAFDNAAFGLPLARPLNFYGDTTGRFSDIGDEYLWGREVLVAPVMTRGATVRKVIFPEGSRWISWWDNSLSYAAGSEASVAAPLEVLPLFVREGAFIPQYDRKIENVGEYDPAFLTIRYYPSAARSEYTLYDDDRLSAGSIERGEIQLTTFSGEKRDGKTSVRLASSGKGYKDMPSVRMLTFEIQCADKAPSAVSVSDGRRMDKAASPKAIRQNGWSFNPDARVLTVRIAWDAKPLEITITD